MAVDCNAYASNANNKTEGFCYIGNGFSDINCCNENLGNGNNMLGTTATTGEVALYVDFGNDYSISNALIYQGSTNNKFYDSYCTNYKIYYSLEEVNKTNNGYVCWKLAGQCNNGTIYNGANIKIKSASNRSSEGDKIIFEEEHVARSIKIVFDKNSCKGTGINGNNSGTIGTVSLLSVRVYGTEYKGTKYNVVIDDEIMDVVAEGENYSLGDVKYGYYSNGIMYPAGYSFAVNKDIEFTSVNDLSITMQEGAGIKLSVPTGLRFMASISSDNMKLIADESAITSGMLITTADNYRNNNMLLDLASTYNMINVINRGWYDKDGDGNTYMSDVGKYCGSIVNIRNSNYDREFISRAYVTINYIDGTKMTIYSNMSVKRSVRFVAEAVRTNGYQGLILEQIGVIDSIIKTD